MSTLTVAGLAQAPPESSSSATPGVADCNGSKLWLWAHPKDKNQAAFHRCPQSFRFPVAPPKTMWFLWNFGNADQGICPYVLVKDRDLFDPRDEQALCKTRKVMKSLIEVANAHNLLPADATLASLSRAQSSDVFDKAFPILIEEIYGARAQKRKAEQSISTLYGKIKAAEKLASSPTAPNTTLVQSV
jgi:hypothetical protein